jgi:hypothetical protein
MTRNINECDFIIFEENELPCDLSYKGIDQYRHSEPDGSLNEINRDFYRKATFINSKEEKKKDEFKKFMELQEIKYRKFLVKKKDKERLEIILYYGWIKKISKKTNNIYWIKDNESIWDDKMYVIYNPWLEFYSYYYDKQFWYHHITKENTWINPNL